MWLIQYYKKNNIPLPNMDEVFLMIEKAGTIPENKVLSTEWKQAQKSTYDEIEL